MEKIVNSSWRSRGEWQQYDSLQHSSLSLSPWFLFSFCFSKGPSIILLQMIRYNGRYIITSRTAWAVRWDLIHVELWEEPGMPSKYSSSRLFLSFMEKSVFTQECFQKAQRNQGEMSKFAAMFLCSNFGFHYELDLGFTVARKLHSLFCDCCSLFLTCVTNFETIIQKSVAKLYMCLCAHMWIHACVHITCMILRWNLGNHRYSKPCHNFVQQEGRKRLSQCEPCIYLLNHCTVLALAEAMFASVSMITIFRRTAGNGTDSQSLPLSWATFFTGIYCTKIHRFSTTSFP